MRANDLNLQLKALASRTYDGQLVRVVDTTIVTMGNQFLVAICSCIVQSAHAARSFVKELKTLGKKTNSFDIADKIISDCNPSMRRKISSQLRTDLDESWNKKASIALILTESAVQEQAYYQEFRSLPKSQRIMTQPEYTSYSRLSLSLILWCTTLIMMALSEKSQISVGAAMLLHTMKSTTSCGDMD